MGSMQQIRAILFDCGGTLVEGAMPWYEVYRRALNLARHPLPQTEMVARYEAAIRRMTSDRTLAVSIRTGSTAGLASYLAEEFGLSEDRLRLALDEVVYDYPEARHMVPVDGVPEVLEQLKQRGYRLAVVSNWSVDLPRVLSAAHLDQHFEGIFASEAVGYSKPHAAAFLVPLERLGLTPGISAYVGDLYDVDVAGSRDVGLTPVLFDPLGLGLHPDVLAIRRLRDLLSVFTGTRQVRS